jgi:diacylglycerol kinase family enzyme
VGLAETFAPEGVRLRSFINVAGVGFDAHIVARTPNDRWGALGYLAALPAGFASYQAKPLALSVDGQKVSGTIFVAFTALGRYCGAGMHVAPHALADDGLFDVVIIEDLSAFDLLLNVRRLFDGSIESYRKVKVLRGRTVDIAGPEPVPAEADGELLPSTPIRLSVLPHAVRVVVP